MLTVSQLPINASCSFQVYPSAVLGAGFSGAKILAILDAQTCYALGVDVASLHANVYPTLPGGVPNDYTAYSYVKFQLASGQIQIIGIPWIIDNTFAVSTNRTVQLSIDNVSDEDVNKMLLALSANGYSAVKVSYPTPQ